MNTRYSVSINWLAYTDSLSASDILKGAGSCASDLVAIGLDAVELPIAHVDGEIENLNGSYWQEIADTFAGEGLRVESVHGPVFSFGRPPGEECERLRRYAEAAVILGARSLVVHPVNHPGLHVCGVTEKALHRDVELATKLAAALEGSRCSLAIENVPHNSWAYLRELFRRLPAEAGLCFDTGHFQVRPEMDLTSALDHFQSRIACWHLNDNHGLCDAHLPPGAGIFDWAVWKSFARDCDAPQVIELSVPARWEDARAREISLGAYQQALSETLRVCGSPGGE